MILTSSPLIRQFHIAGIFFIALMILSCNSNQTEKASTAPDAKTEEKAPETDIHAAIVANDIKGVTRYIAAGGDVNKKDLLGGSSPLITAAIFDRPEMVIMLLEAGADINFQNNDQSTALHGAAFFCRTAIVRVLLGKGADKTIRNKFGATAYDSVIIPFSEAKGTYDIMGSMLGPMGLKLDYDYLEKTRPVIAGMLK